VIGMTSLARCARTVNAESGVINVDFVEAGSVGPVVMLVHSSVSGARQWRRLMEDLRDRFRVRAVNLFGYGKTPPWPAEVTQSLDDQARLVEAALPANAGEIYLVGHSFGGSVAMKAAARLAGRVARLVLLETNPFYLLAQSGRIDAFAEAMELRDSSRNSGRLANGRLPQQSSPITGVAQEPGGKWRWSGAPRSRRTQAEFFRMGCGDE
jgi:pimeloyl-ACP methyl ester carboxylesterase